MSDADTHESVEQALAAEIDSDSDQESEEVNSDAEAEPAVAEPASEKEDDAESEVESDEVSAESEPKSDDVSFDFRDTPTSIQKLVSNLSTLSTEERASKISNLSRQAEIDAAQKAFPDDFGPKETPVSRKEYEALQAQLKELGDLNQMQELKDLVEQGKIIRPDIEESLRNSMLKDQFGTAYKDVIVDPKFIEAYDKYPTLSIEERLEIACGRSAVARKMAVDKMVKQDVSLRAAASTPKGQTAQKAEKKETSAEEYLTEAGIMAEFGDALEALVD